MMGSAGDTQSELVLQEIEQGQLEELPPPVLPQDDSQDWDEDSVEALRVVGLLPPAALPEAAGSNLGAELPGPTQMWVQHSAAEPEPVASQRGRSTARETGTARHRVVRRRLRGKQPPPWLQQAGDKQLSAMEAMLMEALAAEEDEGPGLLPTTAKRKHVHWTFVRTFNKKYKQPHQFSRKKYWEHIAKCYKEVYPDKVSPTGSISQFGLVAAERHKNSPKEADRSDHKHCACFCSSQHYWNKVAKHSLEKYNVPLNAVAHNSYITMYAYLRQPTKKKPLHEIDAEPYLSDFHPRGADLVKLLGASQKGAALTMSRLDGGQHGGDRKRKRLSIFEEVQTHELRTVTALRAHACVEAKAGNTGLAEFCTRQGAKLEDVLLSAWATIDAPSELSAQGVSLMDKLVQASRSPCVCDGLWMSGAMQILERNHIPCKEFCAAVLRALRLGAKRGSNVACIGEGGCGKSTLLEVLLEIFSCAPKAEEGSTFPLASTAGYDVILWQDYEHDEGTIRFSDLLSFFCGEGIGLRRPGALNTKFHNKAPCFYSGRACMSLAPSKKHTARVVQQYNGMMDERFTVFRFWNPIPKAAREMHWPQCGRCGAEFFLTGAGDSCPDPLHVGGDAPPLQDAPHAVSGPPSGSLSTELEKLAQLFSAGVLDAGEFKAAKQRLLSL